MWGREKNVPSPNIDHIRGKENLLRYAVQNILGSTIMNNGYSKAYHFPRRRTWSTNLKHMKD